MGCTGGIDKRLKVVGQDPCQSLLSPIRLKRESGLDSRAVWLSIDSTD